MNPKNIFCLAVRLLGLFFIYLAAQSLPIIFSGPPGQVVMDAILTAAFYVAIGWWLLGGAPLLTQRAYPETAVPTQGGPYRGAGPRAGA